MEGMGNGSIRVSPAERKVFMGRLGTRMILLILAALMMTWTAMPGWGTAEEDPSQEETSQNPEEDGTGTYK